MCSLRHVFIYRFRDAVVHVRKFSQANSVIVYRLLLSSCIEENAYLHQYCGELTAGGNDTLLGDIGKCLVCLMVLKVSLFLFYCCLYVHHSPLQRYGRSTGERMRVC